MHIFDEDGENKLASTSGLRKEESAKMANRKKFALTIELPVEERISHTVTEITDQSVGPSVLR